MELRHEEDDQPVQHTEQQQQPQQQQQQQDPVMEQPTGPAVEEHEEEAATADLPDPRLQWTENAGYQTQRASQRPKRAAAPPPSRPAAATNKIAKMGTATAATSDPPMATWVSLLAPAVREVFGREQVYALAQTAGKLPFL